MEDTKIKEELSISYISTVAAVAGIDYQIDRHDGDSTDGTLKKWVKTKESNNIHSSLRVQLKCTSSDSQYSDDGSNISYCLKVKNYNDLCAKATTPIILCLMIIPEDEGDWIKWTEEELIMKGCMYWQSFANSTPSINASSVTVKIDKSHVVNSKTLLDLLTKIAEEDDL